MGTKRVRRWLTRLVVRYQLIWFLATILIYAAAIPFTILVFPDTTLVLSVIVLFGGFTSSVAALAQVLTTTEEDTAKDEAEKN